MVILFQGKKEDTSDIIRNSPTTDFALHFFTIEDVSILEKQKARLHETRSELKPVWDFISG